jgi:hypothetical protein
VESRSGSASKQCRSTILLATTKSIASETYCFLPLFTPIKTRCNYREDKIKGRPSCQHVEINVDVCPVPLIRGSSQISLEIPRADKRIKGTKKPGI